MDLARLQCPQVGSKALAFRVPISTVLAWQSSAESLDFFLKSYTVSVA